MEHFLKCNCFSHIESDLTKKNWRTLCCGRSHTKNVHTARWKCQKNTRVSRDEAQKRAQRSSKHSSRPKEGPQKNPGQIKIKGDALLDDTRCKQSQCFFSTYFFCFVQEGAPFRNGSDPPPQQKGFLHDEQRSKKLGPFRIGVANAGPHRHSSSIFLRFFYVDAARTTCTAHDAVLTSVEANEPRTVLGFRRTPWLPTKMKSIICECKKRMAMFGGARDTIKYALTFSICSCWAIER